MITLTMERLDHAVVLKLPTDHEHVMVALWRMGLNRDPHMYTLGELNTVFSYDTPEEHQMVRLIDMNNSLHFALCSLHEMLAPPVPYAQQLRKKLQSGSYRSAKDFYALLSLTRIYYTIGCAKATKNLPRQVQCPFSIKNR